MSPINKFVPVAVVFFLAYLAGLYRLFTHFDENRCGMTYMYGYPQFINVPIPQHSPERNFDNYRLYLYAEGRFVEKVRHLRLTGIPVLFIPGNGGSYKQVRSLASISLHKGLNLKARFHFNFFSLDLNKEYSALFGGVLNDQTKFAQESIRAILSLYPSYQRPISLILVGHSMGGIIAKGLMLDEYFDSSAVKVILTLASPHIPIVLFDEYLGAYYKEIDVNWQKKTKNVTLISIGGGNRDLHVRGALTHESSADVDVLVPNIPGVWKSTDHLCILWCKSLVKVINRAFFDVIDSNTMQVHQSDAVRLDVFKYHFQHRSNGKQFHYDLHLPSMKFDPSAKWIEVPKSRFRYFEDGGISKSTYLMIPIASLSQNFQYDLLTVDVENLKAIDWIFTCRANENSNGKYCQYGENLSKHGHIMPTLTQKRKHIKIKASDINTDYFTHVVVKIVPENDPVSVSVDLHKSVERIVTTELPSLFSFGETVISSTEPGALTYTVQISNLENEVQAGYLFLKPIKCEKSKHYAVLQTKVPWSQESTHIFSSYKKPNRLFLKLYRPKPVGETEMAAVSLILDPNCIYSVSIESSFLDSLAAVVQIYSVLLIPNIVGILLLTLSAQLMNLGELGECSMYHTVLVTGAQHVQTLCITNIATHILSVVGVIPAAYYQLNLWMTIFYYTVGFAILYIVGFGLWYSLVFSTNKVSDIVLSFLTRFLGSIAWSEWILSGLEQIPIIVAALLAALASNTCGGLSLWLGGLFYYLKLCSLYEDFLNYYIYYPFRFIKNQLKQRLSWKSNAEINDMWRKNMPPSTDDDANDLTPLHFHFTLFLLWATLAILNVPSTLVWAGNYKYKVHLESDPSWLPGLALSLSAAFIWPGSCPNREINYYGEISYLTYLLALVCFIFCQHTIYYLQYIITLIFILISAHQFVGKYLPKKLIQSVITEVENLALPRNEEESEHQRLMDSDNKVSEDDEAELIATELAILLPDSELAGSDEKDSASIPAKLPELSDLHDKIFIKKLEESDSAVALEEPIDLIETNNGTAVEKQYENLIDVQKSSDLAEISDERDSKKSSATSLDSGVDNNDLLTEKNTESDWETVEKDIEASKVEFSTSEENDIVTVFKMMGNNLKETPEETSSSDESDASDVKTTSKKIFPSK